MDWVRVAIKVTRLDWVRLPSRIARLVNKVTRLILAWSINFLKAGLGSTRA